jgi:hypothetical protein
MTIFITSGIVLATSDDNCDSHIEIIRHLIYPDVRNAVKEHYDEYTKVNSYDLSIISIEPDGHGNLVMVVQFHPFKGAHNFISNDEITFLVTNKDLTIQNYRQLQD